MTEMKLQTILRPLLIKELESLESHAMHAFPTLSSTQSQDTVKAKGGLLPDIDFLYDMPIAE